jgi:hypothetical protein
LLGVLKLIGLTTLFVNPSSEASRTVIMQLPRFTIRRGDQPLAGT